MIRLHALGALALVLSFGCAKSDPPPPPAADPAPPLVATVPPVPPPSAAPEPTAAADIPTEEDFEEEAGRELNAANLDAQLDALEKEILAE